jgi:DNA-binding SARP family transcriptional activator
MELRFRALGTLRAVTADGRELAAPNGTPTELLARLLLRPGEWVPGDELLAAQWPETARQAAQHSLHVAISSLRRALGPCRGLVENRRGSYRVAASAEQVDVHAFPGLVAAAARELDAGRHEHAVSGLQEALALTGGEPFAGVSGEPFEAIRVAHRRAVDEARGLELELLIAAGRWDEAVAAALAAVADGASARAWEALARAEYLRDGPEAALGRLAEARAAGAGSWALERLRHAVLSGDRAHVLAPRGGRAGAPAAGPARPEVVDVDRLLARADGELRTNRPGEAVRELDERYRAVSEALERSWRERRFARACELVVPLHRYWGLRGGTDGPRWLAAALARPELAAGERPAVQETFALLLARQGRVDAARHYGLRPHGPPAEADPAAAVLQARTEVAGAPDGRPRLERRVALAQLLLESGRPGEAVIEAAGLVAAAVDADDRPVLADGLALLASADPDLHRGGRAAGAAAALAWRLGQRPLEVPERGDDGWAPAWSEGWDGVLALPDRGPTPSAADVVEIVWG